MRHPLFPFLALAALACAHEPSVNRRPERTNRDTITREELRTVQVTNALEAIQRLRPDMLRERGTRGRTDAIVVYVNGQRAGYVDVLRSIRASDVTTIRKINATDATTRHGTGHAGGVIEVTIG